MFVASLDHLMTWWKLSEVNISWYIKVCINLCYVASTCLRGYVTYSHWIESSTGFVTESHQGADVKAKSTSSSPLQHLRDLNLRSSFIINVIHSFLFFSSSCLSSKVYHKEVCCSRYYFYLSIFINHCSIIMIGFHNQAQQSLLLLYNVFSFVYIFFFFFN